MRIVDEQIEQSPETNHAGLNMQAQNIHVEGDVVGGDKIIEGDVVSGNKIVIIGEKTKKRPLTPAPPRLTRAWWGWKVRHQPGQLVLGALGIFLALTILLMALQLPPFQARMGWSALGLALPTTWRYWDPDVERVWRIGRFDSTLLAATDTNSGCVTQDTGLWRSESPEKPWTPVSVPWLEFKDDKGCNLAAIRDWVATTTLPRRIYAATTDRGLIRSQDFGENWEPVGEASLPDPQLYSVALLPGVPEKIFVSGFNDGVYRSTDGGKNWDLLNSPLQCHDSEYVSLPTVTARGALLLSNGDTLYVAPSIDDAPSASPVGMGMYASADGGDCWRAIYPTTKYNFLAMIPIPNTPDGILFAAHDRENFKRSVWQFTWRNGQKQKLWETDEYIAALAFDPDGRHWYAATEQGQVVLGALEQHTVEPFGWITICRWSPNCYVDLTSDFQPGPPLLLANNRVFRWQGASWLEYLFP